MKLYSNYDNMNQLEDSRNMRADEIGPQSLLSAMNKFVEAVNTMDETVMIPSRLRDITLDQKDGLTQGENGSKALIQASRIQNSDLYGFYQMLNAVRTELVRGPSHPFDSDDENSEENEESKKVAAAFRHHITGLYTVLKQMTDSANHLTTKYNAEIGDCSNRITPFAL